MKFFLLSQYKNKAAGHMSENTLQIKSIKRNTGLKFVEPVSSRSSNKDEVRPVKVHCYSWPVSCKRVEADLNLYQSRNP